MTLTLTRAGQTVRCKTCPAVICTLMDGEVRVRVKSQSVIVREARSLSIVCENGHMNDLALTSLPGLT